MIDTHLIDRWEKEHVITGDQAAIMRKDIAETKKETSSNNIIVTISTIGAVIFGLGVILFIGANWEAISPLGKTALLISGTYLTFVLGYMTTYVWKTYTRVGMAILLLSSLLFCATIFLIAQIYHVNANNHWLILSCIVGIAPLVYSMRTIPMATLFIWSIYIWIGFVALRDIFLDRASDAIVGFPALFISTGILIFFLSGFQSHITSLKDISRVYRLTSIHMTLLFLLLLTISFISGSTGIRTISEETYKAYSQMAVTAAVVASASIMAATWYGWKYGKILPTAWWECVVGIGIAITTTLFLFSSRSTDAFTILFSLIFILFVGSLIMIGYRREDMQLINYGITYTSIFIMIKYMDIFYGLLEQSAFFMIGGILLLGGGFFMEKQRRAIKAQFTSPSSALETFL